MGLTFDKKPFQLSSLKGKVVVLMFWMTDCAVCRDQIPELRENIRGWADKRFELVLVRADNPMSDVDSYNAIVSQAVPVKQRFVLDKSGKVIARQNGHTPVAWWDFIADLL